MEVDVVQALMARAREVVLAAMLEAGVEGHLCALLFQQDAPAWAAMATMRMLEGPEPRLSRTTGAAIAGLRAALGVTPFSLEALSTALERELSREPIPSAVRMQDDERWMLGIAAGVQRIPTLVGRFCQVADEAASRSPRWAVVAEWAKWIASGELSVSHCVELVTRPGSAWSFGDALPVLWLAGELLGSHLGKETMLAGRVDGASHRLLPVALLDLPAVLAPLDAAWLLRALSEISVGSNCGLEQRGSRSATSPVLLVNDRQPAPYLVGRGLDWAAQPGHGLPDPSYRGPAAPQTIGMAPDTHAGGATSDLRAFLRSAFRADELRRFVEEYFPELYPDLPEGASLAGLIHEFELLLCRNGVSRRQLCAGLREVRPRHSDQISRLSTAWGRDSD